MCPFGGLAPYFENHKCFCLCLLNPSKENKENKRNLMFLDSGGKQEDHYLTTWIKLLMFQL